MRVCRAFKALFPLLLFLSSIIGANMLLSSVTLTSVVRLSWSGPRKRQIRFSCLLLVSRSNRLLTKEPKRIKAHMDWQVTHSLGVRMTRVQGKLRWMNMVYGGKINNSLLMLLCWQWFHYNSTWILLHLLSLVMTAKNRGAWYFSGSWRGARCSAHTLIHP